MTDEVKPRFRIDSYGDWIKGEGIPIVEDYGIDLFSVQTDMWGRYHITDPNAFYQAGDAWAPAADP